jgi:hypothetical protein
MTAVLTPAPKAQFLTNNGEPLVGGKLYSYAAGTTTPLATYTTYAGNVANTNPVILDSRGEANVWLTSGVLYKLALYDADNALIWTVDNVSSVSDGIFAGPVAGTTATFSGALTAASGAFSGAVSGTTGTFSGNVQMASANGGQLAGLRNRVINGNMTICQRATSTAGITGSTQSFLVDRFRTGGQATAAVVTTSQSSDVPSGLYGFSARIAVTTADTAVASTDVFAIVQPIEGYNIRDLFGTTFTLSFWVRSSKTGIHCVAFSNSGTDRSYVVEYTISVANTWEYKTITVSGGFTTAGTWDLANGTGLSLRFTLVAGSSFQTTAGAWNTGNFFGTSGQVNCLDTIGNIFAITNVQLEVGPVATPFEQIPIGLSLQLCQRYFQTNSYAMTVAKATVSAQFFPIVWNVPFRVTPTGFTYSGFVDNDTSGATALAIYVPTANGASGFTVSGTVTVGSRLLTVAAISAEL